MTNGAQRGIEAIAVKRAVVTDADKVRYRVYRTADDFVAVIAESALMALKVSGVQEPYRIVRDLPTEGVTLESERLAKEVQEERVSLSLKPKEATKKHVVERLDEQLTPINSSAFVSMKLRDLQKSATMGHSVLGPDAVEAVAAEKKPEPAPTPPPTTQAAQPASVAEPPAAEAPISVPTPEPAAPAPAPAPAASAELSAAEVDKLLNQ